MESNLQSCLACAPQLLDLLAQQPQLDKLWQALPSRRYMTGEVLLSAGQTIDRAWFIVSGLVRVAHLSAQGEERNAGFYASGSWVGWGTPPYACTSPVGIVALEETQVIELDYANLRRWQRDFPLVQEMLSDAIRSVLEQSNQREAELLLLNATERYHAFLHKYGTLAERIPLNQVASYLGITNVALSRIRSRLGLVQAKSVISVTR